MRTGALSRLKNILGAIINPATEEKQDDIITAINSSVVDPVGIKNVADTTINPATEEKQDNAITELEKLVGFEIGEYDYISLGYTGSNLTTVIYKTGGAGGTTVATLTLGYDGSDNLITVTKT